MKFSDNVIRDSYDEVYVIRTRQDMESREEFNSLLWEEVRGLPKGKKLYSIPLRDLRIGESIYDKNAHFVAYRSE